MTQTQTAMLEVFQWLYSSTMKPIISTMSTMVTPTTTGSSLERDEWGNNIETYRVDEPPHSPGLSTVSSTHLVRRSRYYNLRLVISFFLQYSRRVVAALELGYLNFCVLFAWEENKQKLQIS